MHPNETVLNDYVEEALEGAARSDVERHVADCPECRTLVDDLRQIRRTASSLDFREPPARVWSRLERAIQLEREHRSEIAGRGLESRNNGRSGLFRPAIAALKPPRRIAWFAAAAMILIAVAVGMRSRLSSTATPAVATNAPAANVSASAQAVEAELRAAEEHYDKAIKGLEQITNAEKGTLDTQTAATLQKNLAVIDQAISESRAAVQAQPASEPAQSSLIESFKAKLSLLQDTVALINEMRKGNEAGAARIGSGLRQKG